MITTELAATQGWLTVKIALSDKTIYHVISKAYISHYQIVRKPIGNTMKNQWLTNGFLYGYVFSCFSSTRVICGILKAAPSEISMQRALSRCAGRLNNNLMMRRDCVEHYSR